MMRGGRRTCDHCGNTYSYAGRFNTLCPACEDLGHIPPFRGTCVLCEVTREMAENEPKEAETETPKPAKKRAARK